jgi:GTP-binding protein Era
MSDDTRHCGYIAILGAPNAGKSTLMNQLVGGKVSIVTPKVQTTRVRVRGVCIEGAAQLVFVDTPGIFSATKAFEKGMVDEAWAGAGDADVLLLLIDAQSGLDERTQAILEQLKRYEGKRKCVAINKVDAVQKPYLLKLAEALSAYGMFERFFMISALKGSGMKELRAWLAEQMPQGAWLYPEDETTDQPLREIAAEITREKLFLRLREELPYSVMVETDVWEQQASGNAKIMQTIFVEREGHKKIIIGDKGAMLKSIGIDARRDIERMIEGKVHLTLFVKVDDRWKDRALAAMGRK